MRRPSDGPILAMEERVRMNGNGPKMYYTRHKTTLARLFKKDVRLDSAMHFTDEVVVMEGLLTKLSNSKYFTNKPSYFILRSDTWSLCQYKGPSELTLLSETYISKYDIVRDISNSMDGKMPYALELLRPNYNSRLRLCTNDSRSLQQWLSALENAIFEVSQPRKVIHNALEKPRDPATHVLPIQDYVNVDIRRATVPPPAEALDHAECEEFVCTAELEQDLYRESNNNSSQENESNEDNQSDNNNEVEHQIAIEDDGTEIAITSPPAPQNIFHDQVFKNTRKVARVAPGLLRNNYHSSANVHSFSASGQLFTLDLKYSLIKPIGTGAYGAVISAKNHATDTCVAIKKIAGIFDDLVDAKRILRETRLLGHFNHKNITKLLDLPPPPSRETFEDMYIIAELMETDLHQVIYSMQPMSDDHIKYFLYQILCALHHIHSAGVIHRDMKPSNILLNSNCDLKICDFGLARGGFPENIELTEYVVTRWYRAPEIMLNCLNYTESVDIWAVGCIFAEMMQREPLFPGNDYIHQLKLIIKFMGTPKQEEVEFVKNAKALRFLTKLPIYKATKLEDAFPNAHPQAIDLLEQMLVFNPDKRISVLDALQHPYLQAFYDPADICASTPFDFGFDIPDEMLTKDALVDLLLEDVAVFHPEVAEWARPVLPEA
ncbi:mitogen-activated protein kinase [Thraustotheca clavata]|uniref:Mitogen-activated protein kinase n=1 Tax=Thraustotheca clavata TaxID=74557 RepID=A0A1V9ZYC0_9STRA|nr:mitogen-activated protein kinase [Thraustotheca clavata]